MCFTERLFTKSVKRSIKKSRRVIRLLKIPAPRPRSRDLDREVVRKHRAVGAIEPIERDAVFAVDLLGRVDGERSRSGFVLALSVVPAGELSARFKSCTLLAANRCAAVTDARATLPTVDWPADSFTQF